MRWSDDIPSAPLIAARIEKLRQQYQERGKVKDQIIDLQLKVLENEADGLGFLAPSEGEVDPLVARGYRSYGFFRREEQLQQAQAEERLQQSEAERSRAEAIRHAAVVWWPGQFNNSASLPEPLGRITTVLGPFDAGFDIEKIEFFKKGEFKTPDPTPWIVKEETVVWTLVAKRNLSVDEQRALLRGPREHPFPRVSFIELVDELRERQREPRERPVLSYSLIPYWHGRELLKGERLNVWTHLGPRGTVAIAMSGATKAVFSQAGTPVPRSE